MREVRALRRHGRSTLDRQASGRTTVAELSRPVAARSGLGCGEERERDRERGSEAITARSSADGGAMSPGGQSRRTEPRVAASSRDARKAS